MKTFAAVSLCVVIREEQQTKTMTPDEFRVHGGFRARQFLPECVQKYNARGGATAQIKLVNQKGES